MSRDCTASANPDSDVLKQAKLPILVAPVCDTAGGQEVDMTVSAVEVQCSLVMNEMELYNADQKFAQAGCVPFLIHRIHSSLHGMSLFNSVNGMFRSLGPGIAMH